MPWRVPGRSFSSGSPSRELELERQLLAEMGDGDVLTLEMDVASYAVRVDDLAEQEGSPVAELRHEMPELVPGISHGNWFRTRGNTVAGEHLHPFWPGEVVRIEP